LVTREEDLQDPDGAAVVKLKVGKDPVEDADRVNHLGAALLQRRGEGARLRLDANQAWEVDEAVAFIERLSDATVAMIDYIEEPIRRVMTDKGRGLCEDWEEFNARTKWRVPIAVDESLTESQVTLEDLASCSFPLAAVVLKPTLQGLEQTLAIATWARDHRVQAVLSSAFESGVALSHFAILAGCLASLDGGPLKMTDARCAEGDSASKSLDCSNSTPPLAGDMLLCHGLGTFARLAEDVLDPPFADLVVCSGPRGWRTNVCQCQGALDRTVDGLLDAAGTPTNHDAWW